MGGNGLGVPTRSATNDIARLCPVLCPGFCIRPYLWLTTEISQIPSNKFVSKK